MARDSGAPGAIAFDPTTNLPVIDYDETQNSYETNTNVYNFAVGDIVKSIGTNYLSGEFVNYYTVVPSAQSLQASQRASHSAGYFNFDEVAQNITDKMISRHPHVFGEEGARSKEFHRDQWEEHKKRERAEKALRRGVHTPSILDDVALSLPALMRSEKLGKRAAKVGFDWPDIDSVFEKMNEEIQELKNELEAKTISREAVEEELGDMLLTVVSLARHLHVNPELALRRGSAKFEQRFRFVEKRLEKDGYCPEKASLEELESLWQDAKQRKISNGKA